MSAEEWTALSVLVAVVVAVATWVVKIISDRRSDRVHLAVARPTFHTADQPFNPVYAFCVGVNIINAGPGTAFDVALGTIDPEKQDIYSEWQTLPALTAGQDHTAFLGIHGPTAADDPQPEEAWAYYQRLLLVATCWDRRGRQYLFSPAGGGRVIRNKIWKNKNQMYEVINSGEPARGEPPIARGVGAAKKWSSR